LFGGKIGIPDIKSKKLLSHLKMTIMKKMFIAGAVIISAMAFASSAHPIKNQNHVYRTGYSSMDTVPKKDTTKKDSISVNQWK
jgi:hypothetical protein